MKKNTNTLNLRAKDPFLEREKQRYENPLPSREWIISVLEETGVPVKIPNLAEKLSITEAEYEFFERRIKAMARDGQAQARAIDVGMNLRGDLAVTPVERRSVDPEAARQSEQGVVISVEIHSFPGGCAASTGERSRG